jgi:UDP-N-acetylglucosamine--N-acetylmuramyl-(pentapeptide) pyrophosphoryl-undecaprenol N-acetylglucosamine transferase
MSELIMLAAGGTGGHLFPAQALAEELVARGYRTQLVTDERVRDYGKSFPAEKTHIVYAATITPKKFWKVPGQVVRLYRGLAKAKAIYGAEKPAAVVGFGGYPSFAPLRSAAQMGIAAIIHEQNAVLGRANGALAVKVDALASSFASVSNLKPEAAAKLTFTGNPVRGIVLKEQSAAYPALRSDSMIKLVVFGGSQGAKFFSEFMPKVFAAMDPALRKRIELVQQCRAEDIDATRAAYNALDFTHELEPFFSDMPKRIANAHLIVSRSGASTIAELGVIGRPAVMVPLPGALDNDQLRNAESFATAGAGWVKPQASLEPAAFASFLESLLKGGLTLPAAAAKALTHGKPDAAKRLADLVIKTIAAKSANNTR